MFSQSWHNKRGVTNILKQQNSTDRQGKSTNGEHRIQSSQYRLQACAAEKLMNAMRIIGLFLYEMARETANLGARQ